MLSGSNGEVGEGWRLTCHNALEQRAKWHVVEPTPRALSAIHTSNARMSLRRKLPMRETLSEDGKLTFEPTEQNRRVIAEIRERIRERVRETRKKKKDDLRNLRSLLKREDLVQTDTHM
jgi:polyhydroxyalkanoate synthesis regulator phasin